MCFRTTEYKAAACPRIVKCFLCSRVHHFNNHIRSEIDDYYKKNKNKPTRRKSLHDDDASATNQQLNMKHLNDSPTNHDASANHNIVSKQMLFANHNDESVPNNPYYLFYHQHDLYTPKSKRNQSFDRDLDKFTTPNRKPFLFGQRAIIKSRY